MQETVFFKALQIIILLGLVNFSYSSPDNQSLWLPVTSCSLLYTQSSGNYVFTKCVGPTYTNVNWNSCFTLCCSTNQFSTYSTFSKTALKYCEEVAGGKESDMNAMKISFIVLLVFFLLAFFVSLYCCWKKSMERRANRRQIMEALKLSQIVKDVEWQEQKEINFNKDEKIVWSSIATQEKMLKMTDQPCTICLEEQTMAELFCGHQYHAHCIGSWLKKNIICPCCRRDNIRGAKVYCTSCRWRYYVSTRTLLTEKGKQLPIKCQTCLNNSPSIPLDNSSYQLASFGSSNKLQPIETILVKEACEGQYVE